MRDSRFAQKIRIDPKQLEYIRSHKGTYKTLAGRLDEIINHYKECHAEKKGKRIPKPLQSSSEDTERNTQASQT